MRKRLRGVSRRKNDFLIVLSCADKLKKFLLEYEVEGARKFEPVLVSLPVPPLRQAHRMTFSLGLLYYVTRFSVARLSQEKLCCPPLGSISYTRASHAIALAQQEIANRSMRVIEVDVQDVEKFDQDLGNKIRLNTRRYHSLLSDAVEACLPEPDSELAERDVLDVLLEQRTQQRDGDGNDRVLLIPNELKRRYEVRLTLVHEDKNNYMALRTVRANHIGQLVTIR